jgi:2-amino-4-hydroxy-6-hydroxymethyldihydropteridine diphosphokinase
MNTVVISIGSNAGDRRQSMERAIEFLQDLLSNTCVSSIYETAPEGGVADNYYLNAVIAGETDMDMSQVIKQLKRREVLDGRTLAVKLQGIVPIDLDLVIWNGEVVREKEFSCKYFTIGYNQLLELGRKLVKD